MSETRPSPATLFAWGFVAFFFLYFLSFRALPESIFTARVISLGALVLFAAYAIQMRGRVGINRDILLMVCAYGAYACWVCFITVAGGAEDLDMLKNALLLIVQVFPAALLLALWARHAGFSSQQLMLVIHVIISVQALFIIVSFISPGFRALTFALLHDAEGNVDPLDAFRVRGLTMTTGAKLSAFQAVGLLLGGYLLTHWPRRSMLLGVYVAGATLLQLGSILLTGRTGFLIVPAAFLFVALPILTSGRMRAVLPAVALLMGFGLATGLSLLQTLHTLFGGASARLGDDAVARVVRRVTKEFGRYLSGGSVDSSTVGVLLRNHWIAPQGAGQILFGDPRSWGVARIESDIGIVRMVFGAGLIGSGLLYFSGLLLCALAMRAACSSMDRMLILFLLLWTIVLEFKEPYFLDLRNISLLSLIMMFLCLRKARLTAPAARVPSD